MTPWAHANRQLVAKAIGELHFEEVLFPVADGAGWRVDLQTGVSYRFKARPGAWGHLWVDPLSVTRVPAQGEFPSAGQFFIDSLGETAMGELTLGTFLEELHNTLYADMAILARPAASAPEMADWDDLRLQQSLPGHPKLLLNKGRMGWGAPDLARFAPEASERFRLRWLLARQENLRGSQEAGWSDERALEESFTGTEKERFTALLRRDGGWRLLPVHPWQWENVIRTQFAGALSQGELIDLGEGGDHYAAQTSLRTLSNVDRPGRADIKLPLSILNTSCVRGLPHRYLPLTPRLCGALSEVCAGDPWLHGAGVLEEHAAWGHRHAHFHQVEGAPYRYHEHLGAVWRKSAHATTGAGEQAVLAGALFHRGSDGKTLPEAFAAKAGSTVGDWVASYAREVILPLYHLQLEYGVGLVAHGQNIVVKLRRGLPCGVLLKDFHGDLRLSTAHASLHQRIFPGMADFLTRLPPEHLIHDLFTGHFVTVLRFLSWALEDSKALPESEFYRTVAREVAMYHGKRGSPVPASTDILAPSFPKVLVNRVRFKIGYADNAERPLPILGNPIANPLHRELRP